MLIYDINNVSFKFFYAQELEIERACFKESMQNAMSMQTEMEMQAQSSENGRSPIVAKAQSWLSGTFR